MAVACPFCKSTVEPTLDAAGKKLCPACRNTGVLVAQAAPSPRRLPPAAVLGAIALVVLLVAAGAWWALRPAPDAGEERELDALPDGDAARTGMEGPALNRGGGSPSPDRQAPSPDDCLDVRTEPVQAAVVKEGDIAKLYLNIYAYPKPNADGVVVLDDGPGPCGIETVFEQILGPATEIRGGPTAQPPTGYWFRAPDIPDDETALVVFALHIDTVHGPLPDLLYNFTILGGSANHPPVAVAGPDYAIDAGSPCSLDGRASYDPDSEPVTYEWVLLEGPARAPSPLRTANPSFYCPDEPGILRYRLTVSDGRMTAEAETVITVRANHAPRLVLAQMSIEARVGDVVTLDASATTDADGDAIRFSWIEWNTGGGFELSGADSAVATFTATKAGKFQFHVEARDATAYTWQYVDVLITE